VLGIPVDQKVVLYSGNMGAKQGIETLADAAALLAARADVTFVFCGSGAAKASLIERCAGLTNCVFIPLQPVERLNELLNLADIHVLPQRGDAADLVMPSKLTGMFASGRAVVAMARHGTGLYDAVSPRGVVVPPDNVKALVAAITVLVSDRERRAALGRAARHYAERALSPESTIRTFEERLATLVREPRGEHAHVEPYFGAPKSSTAVAGRRRKPATTEEAAPD
jgi:colanic acid biosynthesis glycosyl transferase WcaI